MEVIPLWRWGLAATADLISKDYLANDEFGFTGDSFLN